MMLKTTNHFHEAKNLLGLSRNEILHIGDHPVNDMQGAIDYGFKALWFNPNKEVWNLEGLEKPPEFFSWNGVSEKIYSL